MAIYQLDFGLMEAEPGYTKVYPDTMYTTERGFGFTSGSAVYGRSRGGEDRLRSDCCIPRRAKFQLDLPDGLYRISILTGDSLADTHTVVLAGAAKYVLAPLQTFAGQWIRESFSLRVTGGQLLLSFSGAAPRINALEIEEDTESLVLFLAGDSTVTDQGEAGYPYAGWGQLLPLLFKPGVAVDNRAISGRSSKSFVDEGHLQRIAEALRPRDYLFIQFGHNDSKSDEARYTEPFTTYKEHLLLMIDTARQAGAFPVLVTSMHRRRFDQDGRIINTHGEYLTAMKELVAAEDVPLIDLEAKSRRLFEEYGPEKCKELFMWSYPGEYIQHPAGVQDNTHFQVHGARLLAELVVEGIREAGLHGLVLFLREGD